MEERRKQVFLNPVLNVPWKSQQQTVEKPELSESEVDIYSQQELPSCSSTVYPEKVFKRKRQDKRKSRKSIVENRSREQNMNTLILRYPGLRKYEARAALTMSHNELDKAIILLELSSCYRRQISDKNLNLGELQNIQINLLYRQVVNNKQRTKNVSFNENFPDEIANGIAYSLDVQEKNHGSVRNIKLVSDCTENKKVGIILAKTESGYKVKSME